MMKRILLFVLGGLCLLAAGCQTSTTETYKTERRVIQSDTVIE